MRLLGITPLERDVIALGVADEEGLAFDRPDRDTLELPKQAEMCVAM